MRVTVFFLLLGIIQVSAINGYSQQTRISIKLSNVSLSDVLNEIEDCSDFYFLYNQDLIDVKRKVSLNAENQSIDKILNQLFDQSGVKYVIQNRQIILTSLDGNFQPDQQKEIRGKVTDTNGVPLPGVTIVVKGTNQGVVTDVDGRYSLSNVHGDAILVFSFVGMKTQEIPFAGESTVDVIMVEEMVGIEEVVAIGYGTQSRATVTTSVSKMDNSVLENVVYPNAASALQGNLSGVRVQTTSGQPGASPLVIVRGGTSIDNPNGSTPLYVIDGILREDMDNIATEDIESIQVLKDAASTSIYGARGSNGVVVITTKKGKAGKVNISYSFDVSFSRPGELYDLANARDYLTFARKAMTDVFSDNSYRLTESNGFGTGNDLTESTAYTTQYLSSENEYKLNEGWESMPDPVDNSKTLIFKDTDWQNVLFRTMALSNNHHISASGGNENSNFCASLGYLNSQGTAITTDLERYTMGINGELRVNQNLKVLGRVNYVTSTDHQVNSITNIFARAVTLPPTTKYKFEDGTLAPGQASSEANPEYWLTNREAETTKENLTFAIGANWEILNGLNFEPQISVYNTTSDYYDFQPAYWNGVNNYVDSRYASEEINKWKQTQLDGVFSYSKCFLSSHTFDAKFGFSYFKRKESELYAQGKGAETDLIPTLNASAEAVRVSSYINKLIMLGYFGRVNYNYKNRYLISFNARYDGSSNLGSEHKWGFFPGISLGWNLHQEDFWQNIPLGLQVKLRGSYGVNGNISGLGDYAAQGTYSVGNKYNNNGAIQNTEIANRELQWERSKTLNFGTDIGLFGNRVKILFDTYRKVTDNLITDYDLPPSTGFSSVNTNLGSLENKGFELELNARMLPARSVFQWDFSFNISHVKTKILELPDNGVENNRVGGYYVWDPSINDYNWLGGLQEGGRIGDYYEYKSLGIYSTDEEAASASYDDIALVHDQKFGGDVMWADLDGNDQIDTKDRYYVGNIYPTWNGGISNSLGYKGFKFIVRMDYTMGHTIYNYIRAFMNGQWKLNMNLTQEMVDHAWQEQGDKTYLPRYNWEGVRKQYNIYPTRTGQQYYESGNFLALREVTLSYELPKSLLFANISSMRFNITGNNLHYFTKYKGLNPEYGGQDYGRYPVPRTWIFGFNIVF